MKADIMEMETLNVPNHYEELYAYIYVYIYFNYI